MLARMAQRRTDTPLFRKALAVVVLWLLAWATIGYLNHRAIQSYDQWPGYREAMQGCAAKTPLVMRVVRGVFRLSAAPRKVTVP